MNALRTFTLFALALGLAEGPVIAQDAPTGQKTLAATVGVYVFPAGGQEKSQQNREEAECYAWAVDNTQSDPFDLKKQADERSKTGRQWAQLIRRIYEADPLLCTCGETMRIVSFVFEGSAIRKILQHLEHRERSARAPPQATAYLRDCVDDAIAILPGVSLSSAMTRKRVGADVSRQVVFSAARRRLWSFSGTIRTDFLYLTLGFYRPDRRDGSL